MDVNKCVGKIIKQYRQEKGLSVKQFSMCTGYSYSTIANYECGTHKLTKKYINKMSYVFNSDYLKEIEKLSVKILDPADNIAVMKYLSELSEEDNMYTLRKIQDVKRVIEKTIDKIIGTEEFKLLNLSDIEEICDRMAQNLENAFKYKVSEV